MPLHDDRAAENVGGGGSQAKEYAGGDGMHRAFVRSLDTASTAFLRQLLLLQFGKECLFPIGNVVLVALRDQCMDLPRQRSISHASLPFVVTAVSAQENVARQRLQHAKTACVILGDLGIASHCSPVCIPDSHSGCRRSPHRKSCPPRLLSNSTWCSRAYVQQSYERSAWYRRASPRRHHEAPGPPWPPDTESVASSPY